MANYDNSRYSYADVLGGSGYFMKDDSLTYSGGVKTLQEKLNQAGFWCGTPDGKFGAGTDEAVRHFQRAYSLTVDGKAGKGTLVKLEQVLLSSPGYEKTSGTYGIYFDDTNKRFMHNQQIVYNHLRNANLGKKAVAAFMGNIEAESEFSTAWNGTGGSVGLCQWLDDRKTKLQTYASAIGEDKTSIQTQAKFIVEECKAGGNYADNPAVSCYSTLRNDTSVADNLSLATDHITARYERCLNFSSKAAAVAAGYDGSRFEKNAYNSKYYIDTPKRRGYAAAYYACMTDMP